MAETLPPHIQQWTMEVLGKEVFEKRLTRSERSNSASTSLEFDDDERIKISRSEMRRRTADGEEMSYLEKYLSSEEELSPMEEEMDDNLSFKSFSTIEDVDIEKAIEAYSTEDWKANVTATIVSIIHTGKPKVIDVLPTPTSSPTVSQIPSRDSSLAKNTTNRARQRPVIKNNRLATYSPFPQVEKIVIPPRADSLDDGSNLPIPVDADTRSYIDPRSSIYSATTPSSPRPLQQRRASVADPAALLYEPFSPGIPEFVENMPTTPTSPATPITPISETQRTPRHNRFKSISRLGLFKNSKKGRNDSLTSASVTHLPSSDVPPMPNYPAPTPPPAISSTFAPAPFVRPQTAKLVARGANERDSGLRLMSAMLSGRPSLGGSDGDDEVTDEEFDELMGLEGPTRLRRKKSLLGF